MVLLELHESMYCRNVCTFTVYPKQVQPFFMDVG